MPTSAAADDGAADDDTYVTFDFSRDRPAPLRHHTAPPDKHASNASSSSSSSRGRPQEQEGARHTQPPTRDDNDAHLGSGRRWSSR
mmetsp:Transcript_11512/g.33452  ORF Transcript_11512/g.33452 Transcript_11512/m.33452 type:complete len:86 (+) Transcript_11512:1-258(+)